MYQKGKFVGKNTIKMTDSVIETIVKNWEAQGFERVTAPKSEDAFMKDLYEKSLHFRKKVAQKLIVGEHQGWYTMYKHKVFKAKPKYISVIVKLQEGYIDGYDPYDWDTQGYSGYVTLMGGIAYKFSRNQQQQLNETTEIYNHFHYDNDIMEMLSDMNTSLAKIESYL